jgi:hypothetical protein
VIVEAAAKRNRQISEVCIGRERPNDIEFSGERKRVGCHEGLGCNQRRPKAQMLWRPVTVSLIRESEGDN